MQVCPVQVLQFSGSSAKTEELCKKKQKCKKKVFRTKGRNTGLNFLGCPIISFYFGAQNKRNMCRKDLKHAIGIFLITVLIASTLCSCSIRQLNEPDSQPDTPWVKPPNSKEISSYVCAMSYPDGYNWLNDEQKGSVRCSLVVFNELVPIMKIPVGNEYEVSSDLDTHYFIDGHLYTSYTGDDHTSIKKDGEILYRFPKAERIVNIAVDSGNVYILGQNLNGNGFSCRKNGEIIFYRESGFLFPHLSLYEGKCQFAFSEKATVDGKVVNSFYTVSGSETRQVGSGGALVHDIIFKEGDYYFVSGQYGKAEPFSLYKNDIFLDVLPSNRPYVPLYSNLHWGDKKLFCAGDVNESQSGSSYNKRCTIIWLGTTVYYKLYHESGFLSAFHIDRDDIPHCIVNQGNQSLLCTEGAQIALPQDYISMGNSTITMNRENELIVALSSPKGKRPIIWRNNRIDTLAINGYITSVSSGFSAD